VFPLGAAATIDELTGNPHPLLARLREGEPVSWLPALNGWLVTRYAEAVRVMRDPVGFTVDDPRFSTARVVGPSMLSLDGSAHAHHRGPFAREFRPAEVRTRFAAFVQAETERLVAAIRPAGEGELRRGVAGPLAVAVVAQALGLAVPAATVLSWYDAIVGAVSGVSAGLEIDPAGVEAFGELSASVQDTIAGQSGLLADVASDGVLRAGEVVSNAAVLMFGGIETTEGMISNAVLHLLDHPEQLAQVAADRTLLANAVEESLRFEPAAAVVDRYATQDVELAGATIRSGDLVTVSIAAANRDPEVFPDPDTFSVLRDNARQHLAFAHGPHACLAADLARLETRTVVNVLLDTLPGLQLARPAAPSGLVFRKPPALHMRWSVNVAR
jgi:cytochrome P450